MQQQLWEESEKREQEARRSTCVKRKNIIKRCAFPMFCGSRRSKSALATAAGAEPSGGKRSKIAVARSACPSQNVKNILAPEHFWKLSCSKSGHGSGAKRMSKSKC